MTSLIEELEQAVLEVRNRLDVVESIIAILKSGEMRELLHEAYDLNDDDDYDCDDDDYDD